MDYWLKFAHWVYDMQGFIAAIAAFGTAGIILSHRRDDRLRKLWFAKSEAIFAVTKLHASLHQTVEGLEVDCLKFEKLFGSKISFDAFIISEISPYPDSALKTLSKLIPVSNKKTASQLMELVSSFQIYKSRLVSFEKQCADGSHSKSIDDFYRKIYEQVELSSWLMQRVLPYARDDIKSRNMPSFKLERDASLVFSSKRILFDPDYNEFCKAMPWPPNLGTEINERKKLNK